MTAIANAQTLTLERTFRASPERLWAAWTDPKLYARWLNPAPIDLVIHEFDVRVGGKVRFDMPQPDGSQNPQEGVFHVLEPHRRLVSGSADKSFLLEVDFEPVGKDQTRMRVTATGVPPEWHAAARQGWGAGLDKLAADLDAPEGGFGLERTFRAPPQRVWEMWTTKAGIEAWWAVSAREMGYDMKVLKLDVRVGGSYAFSMRSKEHDLVNGGTYTRVEPHRELGMLWHFDIFLAPGEKPYPVPIRIQLDPTPEGGTRMRFTQGPLSRPGHTEGSRQGVMANLAHLAKALGEPAPGGR